MTNMYSHYYFIGIGGIGMSAIARYFKHQGFEVSGYDRTPSALTHALEAEGIPVHYEDDVTAIPQVGLRYDDQLREAVDKWLTQE